VKVRPQGAIDTLQAIAPRGALQAPRHAGCGPVPHSPASADDPVPPRAVLG